MYVLVVLPLGVAFATFEENDVTGIICTLVFVADILLCFRTGTAVSFDGLLIVTLGQEYQ